MLTAVRSSGHGSYFNRRCKRSVRVAVGKQEEGEGAGGGSEWTRRDGRQPVTGGRVWQLRQEARGG